MEWLKNLHNKVLEGYTISKEEALKLAEYDTKLLSECAEQIREKLCGNTFDLCSIVNGKSGACSENCKYCAQSAHYNTQVETYPLLDEATFVEDAKAHEQEGVVRYSVVTSGKRLSKLEVEGIAEIYSTLKKETNLKLCASHGLLDEEDFIKLKAVGIVRYHNNLETSKNYFGTICTTHTYEDKIQTIQAAQKVGLEVCSGGLFGLGETMDDRIDMAFDLRALGIRSIPINVLVPIPGTPMEKVKSITEDEVLKSIAIYRFIHPTAFIRLAGGRMYLTDNGRLAFQGGANAAISGNLLTTCGNTIQDDLKMLGTLGFEVKLGE